VIEITKVPLAKEFLQRLTKEERSLLFLLGYAANKVSMLLKLVIFSSNKIPSHPVEQNISAVQTGMLLRLLIGELSEALRLVHERFLQKPLGKEYLKLLDEVGRNALSGLKDQIGGSGLLSRLRNNYVFHYPKDDEVERAFRGASNDPDWDGYWAWYLSDNNHNSSYLASDVVILHAMLGASGKGNLIKSHERILKEAGKVNECLSHFALSFFEAVLTKYSETQIKSEICQVVKDAPNVFDFWLPVYIETPNNPK
jgi:hypothetical protein